MPSTLGKYQLIRTLGAGAFSKVKLGVNSETGQQCAIKIHRTDKPDFNQRCVDVIETEARAVSQLDHQGIVNIIDYIPRAMVEKQNGQKYEVVCVIVNELAQGGELFYFVKNSGHFAEHHARYLYHQMISALKYVHGEGLAHRDIKPDNLLLDANFNIKIADFGFAGPMAGRNNEGGYNGFLTTQLGTVPYQAPEINEGNPYSGEAVDLFALNIVLFIITSALPPFKKADNQDFYYKLIITGRIDDFWRYHSQDKAGGAAFFSPEFKDFITKAFQYDPQNRMTMAQIEAHPWYKGALPSYNDFMEEMRIRKATNDLQIQQERAARNQARQRRAGAYDGVHRGVNGGDDDDDKKEEEVKVQKYELSKNIREYVHVEGFDTGFVINENPDTIMEVVEDFLTDKQDDEEIKFEFKDDQYKAVVNYEGKNLLVEIKITRIGDADSFHVEFVKKNGYLEEFLEFAKQVETQVNKKFGYLEGQDEEDEKDDQ